MKVKLPIIGQVRTGKDSQPVEVIKEVAGKEKFFDILGGMMDLSPQNLSSEKTISTKLLQANKGWVYRNNDVIAQEVSKMDFELFTIGLSDGEIVFNEVTTHPLLDLLDKPNEETTKNDAVYIIQSHKKLTGDAFWLKIRNGQQVIGLRAIEPDKIELKLRSPTVKDPTVIEAYIYKDRVDGKYIEVVYDPKDIIHFKKPNPRNPFRGLGAVEALSETIDHDNLTLDVMNNFLKNGAIHNFALTTDQKITEDQLKRLKAELRASMNGPKNAFTVPIFGGGLTPADISYSNKEQQLLDQQAWDRDKIMIGFGNTKASLGMIDDVNRASHESSLVEWKRNTVAPDMTAIVNTLNEFLVPEFGENLVLGFTDPVPEDRGDDILESTELYGGGIITLNEARELLDYDETDDGDTFKQPTGPVVQPVDPNADPNANDNGNQMKTTPKLPPALKSVDIKSVLRRRGAYLKQKQNAALKEAAKVLIEESRKAKKSKNSAKAKEIIEERRSPNFTNQQINDYWQKQIHIVEVVEQHFENKLKQFISKVGSDFLKQFDDEVKTQRSFVKFLKKDFFSDNEDDLLTQAGLDFEPLLSSVAVMAGNNANKLIGINDPYLPFNYRSQIASNVAKFTKSMLDTDRDHLTNIITNGLQDGKSVGDIRNLIEADFGDYSKMQATRISRTEVLRTSNQASLDAFEQSGVVEGKQWVTFGASDECEDYDGQVVTLSDSFYGGDNEFQDGDPPLHPNCRCVVIPIVD